MSPDDRRDDAGTTRLDELLAEYFERQDRGEPVDPEQFLAEHPEVAAELRAFFSVDNAVAALAASALSPLPLGGGAGRVRGEATATLRIHPGETPAAAPPTPPVFRHLRVFGDYELLEEIARGGMGVVYKARQRSLNRVVALKMILAGRLASPGDVRRFRSEAEAAAHLDHPSIIPIYEVGEIGAQPYFTMKFVEGGNLADHLPRYRQDHAAAARLLIVVARAVHYAHRRGILHRDLKPANILLQKSEIRNPKSETNAKDRNPKSQTPGTEVSDLGTSDLGFVSDFEFRISDLTPYVTDFGLAKRVTDESGQTRSGDIVGSPCYMAPEQAGGQRGGVTVATDVYGLGTVLYEMLTGQPPFRGETALATLLLVKHQEPERPRTLDSSVDRDLETICLKCLEKEPRRRYGAAEELALDLERWLAGEPIQARPRGLFERAWRWSRRHPGAAGLGAVVAMFIVMLVNLVFEDPRLRAVVFLAGVGVMALFAAGQYRRLARQEQHLRTGAEQAKSVAERRARAEAQAREQLEANLYFRRVALAQREFAVGDVGRAEELLDECPPPLRGWEWYYLKDGRERGTQRLQGHLREVRGLAFSPDGRRLASGGHDHTVRLWEVSSGMSLHTLQGHAGYVWGVAFSPDGRRLASASWDGTVRVWDVESGHVLATFARHAGPVYTVGFSPDGQRVASAGADGVLRVWDAASAVEHLSLREHAGGVGGVAFSPDGNRLASAGEDDRVCLWDAATGKLLHALRGHAEVVTAVAFSADGRRLASASYDQSIKLWDAESGRELLTLTGHTLMVFGVAFSPDGRRLASAGFDRTVKLWDTETGQEAMTFHDHTATVTNVAFSPDGWRLASAGRDRVVLVRDAALHERRSGRISVALASHTGLVFAVAFSPDGRQLASASCDKTVKLWDLKTGRELRTLAGHAKLVRGVAFHPDGRRLASSSWDTTVKLWDAHTGQELATLRGHTGYVGLLAFSPRGDCLVSAGSDGTLRVWDVESMREVGTLAGHQGMVIPAVFAPDGERFASATDEGTVKIWDATDWRELRTLTAHSSPIFGLKFSPDGALLASVGFEGVVKLWDVSTGREVRAVKSRNGTFSEAAFHPGGHLLAAAHWDGVTIWDLRSGAEVVTLGGHHGVVWDVCFSPDGHFLASTSGYSGRGEVRLWDATVWGGMGK